MIRRAQGTSPSPACGAGVWTASFYARTTPATFCAGETPAPQRIDRRNRSRAVRSRRRRGFSLLEVLLATALLVGSLVVLSELASIGRIHASVTEDGTTALRICRNKMNEIQAGLEPVASVRQQTVDGEPGWVYSVETDSVRGRTGLVAVRVRVRQEEGELGRPLEFSLVRWIRDPKLAAGSQASSGDKPGLSRGRRGGRMP